jgi:hypothetical protein
MRSRWPGSGMFGESAFSNKRRLCDLTGGQVHRQLHRVVEVLFEVSRFADQGGFGEGSV